ncbi:Thiamine-phosphate synthase [compost metagenome]
MIDYPKLQYISQGTTAADQYRNITKVLKEGCSWIQLRWKGAPIKDLKVLVQQVLALKQEYTFTFILNDHTRLALDLDLDGVHLGLEDMSVAEARIMLGPDKIIGGTANTLADVQQRIAEGCDYIGLGPYRFTTTKEKLSPVLGLEGYRTILNSIQYKPVPVFAIGGIDKEDIPALMTTGISGIAASGLLTHSAVPEILQLINYSTCPH